MKTFKFSLVLRTRENNDVFISLDDNIYGIYSKRINILYVLRAFSPVYDSLNGIYHATLIPKKIAICMMFEQK